MIDLDHIEAVARAAKEDHDLSGFRSWGTWFEEMNIGIAEQRLAEECSPDVVLALVARVRELTDEIESLMNEPSALAEQLANALADLEGAARENAELRRSIWKASK